MQNISHKALDPPLNLKSYVMDNIELMSLGHKMALNWKPLSSSGRGLGDLLSFLPASSCSLLLSPPSALSLFHLFIFPILSLQVQNYKPSMV